MTYQTGDALGGLVFVVFIIAVISLILRVAYLSFKKIAYNSVLEKLLLTIISYSFLLLAVSYLSKEQIIPNGTNKCFDDWCASVLSAERADNQTIVSIKVTNNALRATQTPDNPEIALVSSSGVTYKPSSVLQKKFEEKYGLQPSLSKKVLAAESFTTRIVFNVPQSETKLKLLLLEGAGVDGYSPVIGDEKSPFHKKSYFELSFIND